MKAFSAALLCLGLGLGLAGCGHSSPAPVRVPLPSYRAGFTLPVMRSYPVSLFGEVTETSMTASSCGFEWNTGHPVDHQGTAVVRVGQTVTLHADRVAEFTLTAVSSAGCVFVEFLPASP